MEHLSTIMRPIRYGYLTKDGKKRVGYDIDNNKMFYEYVLETPQEVMANKLGVCWDQVEVEREYCDKNEIPYSTYFSIVGKNNDTHTFLVFKTEDNQLYYFENSWQNFRGIHGPFTSVKDIFKTIYRQTLPMHKYMKLMRFYKYGRPQYGCNMLDFQKFAMKHLVYTIREGVTH